MGAVVFDPVAFRVLFPAFADATAYPDLTLEAYFATATVYINNRYGGYCGAWSVTQLTLALNQMTAHLLAINNLIMAGQSPGIEVGATIDKISVTIEPPPAPNQWQYWLQSTPYGQQLLALLQALSAGGFYVTTGVPGRLGFQGGIN